MPIEDILAVEGMLHVHFAAKGTQKLVGFISHDILFSVRWLDSGIRLGLGGEALLPATVHNQPGDLRQPSLSFH